MEFDIMAGAEEALQDTKELFNETGVPIEPFNLDKEREEGAFHAGGGYLPFNHPQVKDAWLESIDGKPCMQADHETHAGFTSVFMTFTLLRHERVFPSIGRCSLYSPFAFPISHCAVIPPFRLS